MLETKAAPTDVSARWQELEKLKNAWLFLFFGFIPVIGIAAKLISGILSLLFLIAYVGAFLYISHKLDAWKCPRCGNSFLREKKRSAFHPFNDACANCQLPFGGKVKPEDIEKFNLPHD
ncbi:MAG TPA: hypothetical protein VK976_11850 [Verrucomicrobiae bacterium]|jgi:predicted RNA-binding Zn-ribbon protein involved in translation (DUF1610 family)|nr:hypothetical protein [Verrucomicrobiae bacterium]